MTCCEWIISFLPCSVTDHCRNGKSHTPTTRMYRIMRTAESSVKILFQLKYSLCRIQMFFVIYLQTRSWILWNCYCSEFYLRCHKQLPTPSPHHCLISSLLQLSVSKHLWLSSLPETQRTGMNEQLCSFWWYMTYTQFTYWLTHWCHCRLPVPVGLVVGVWFTDGVKSGC